jgi:HSP20 family molecular chaperone IbpA
MSNTNVSTSQSSEAKNPQSLDFSQQRVSQPAVDVVEDASGITMWMDLPGVPSENLDLQVHDATLYIKAEATVSVDQDLRLHHVELQVPRFKRSFALSQDFDPDKIEANLSDGVLKVTIPRHEKARPRRIAVQTS